MRQAVARGQEGWRGKSGRPQRPAWADGWAGIVALLLPLVLSLLLVFAFHAVVRSAVVQGDARRVESARQSDAAAACGRLPGRERRSRCRAGIG